MTTYMPTHVVDIERDAIDGATTTVATGVLASVLRQSGSGRGGAGYRYDDSSVPVTIRLPHGTPCTQGDRIVHTASGVKWLVDTASTNANPVTAADVIATCRDLDGGT